jgi:hypothetical protein
MGLSWLPEQVAIAVYDGVRKSGDRTMMSR